MMALIELSSVQLWGNFEGLEGGVSPSSLPDYQVVVYAYRPPSWWWCGPVAGLGKDGIWVATITAGPCGKYPLRIAAFLVDNTFDPPPMFVGPTPPKELQEQSIAHLETSVYCLQDHVRGLSRHSVQPRKHTPATYTGLRALPAPSEEMITL